MTGSRGPISKPAHLRQRRNKPTTPLVLAGKNDQPIKPPKPPEGLLKVTLDRWRAFWKSDIAKHIREVHRPMVERLFQRYDERERAYRVVRKQGRVAKGSRGQIVRHPLMRYVDTCDAEIGRLEDRLGLSLRGMTPTGGGPAQPASLDDLNAQLEADDDGIDHDDDPRLQLAQ